MRKPSCMLCAGSSQLQSDFPEGTSAARKINQLTNGLKMNSSILKRNKQASENVTGTYLEVNFRCDFI
jgi:hypothetical protein